MKERYNIEIAGIGFSIVSDDGNEFVRQAESALAKSVDEVLTQNKRLSKLDAVTLVALDYSGELLKAEAKIRNLEAQIEILETANQQRRKDVSAPAEEVSEPETNEDEAESEAEAVAESAETSSPADDGEEDGGRDQKFRQLEALLGSQLKFDLDD